MLNKDCIKEFKCVEDLTPYVDSMLFDSNTVIATMKYEDDDWELFIDLGVRGDVRVEYKGETYRYPSDFPDELIERIKTNPNWWDITSPSGEGEDDGSNVYIQDNNWFEYIFDIRHKRRNIDYTEGELYEADLSEDTPEGIKEDMFRLLCEMTDIGSEN